MVCAKAFQKLGFVQKNHMFNKIGLRAPTLFTIANSR